MPSVYSFGPDAQEALWADIDQRIGEGVDSAAQDVADEAVELAREAAAQDIEEAIEAVGDISELAVPLMTQDIRGGAKLGSGLTVEDGALSSKIVFEYETVGDIDMPTITIDY